ncbi:hypothetical protein JOQ06_015626 [Pogonophryne albipinna]|uniref:Uncharacterized protein n=1 Tax=Pogonophryne albipinna TaxID=1090488 RepID=A0AAD6FAL3_9TELE|nr:hypothetical protein JOQ06_015626 [Pogonophryne albipinna]
MRKPARSQSTQQTPPQSSEAGTRRTFIPECTISEERAIQCKEWLKHNSQPLNQVEQYMQDTAVYRAKSLRENGWDIQGIRQEFPHLFTPGMIAQDFQILHGEAAPKLFETWLPLFKDKILHLARREGKLISSLNGLTPDCLGELALSQLPTLLPPTVYRSKLAFIDHKPVGTNLVEYLHEAKVFYIFDIDYTKQCEAVWKFLQNAVYEIKGGEESKPATSLRAAILACK